MTKQSLIEKVAGECEITKAMAGKVVDAVFSSITESCRNGDGFKMVGFGSFSISERKERKGRNPKTGEPIHIPASKVVKFKASKEILEG